MLVITGSGVGVSSGFWADLGAKVRAGLGSWAGSRTRRLADLLQCTEAILSRAKSDCKETEFCYLLNGLAKPLLELLKL